MKILVKWESYLEEGGSEAQEMEIEQVEKDTAQKVIDRFFDAVTVDEAERERMLLRITPQIKIDAETMDRLNEEIKNAPLTVFDSTESSIEPIFGADAALNAFESIVEHYPELKGVECTLSAAVETVRKQMNAEAEARVKAYAESFKRMNDYEMEVNLTDEKIKQKRDHYRESQEKGIDLDDAAERIADWKKTVDEEKGGE